MSIDRLIFTQKMVLNIPTSRMQGKMQTFEQQHKCLILLYFTQSQIQTNMDLNCQKWHLFYADALNALHITKAVDYIDLFMWEKQQV